MSFKTLLHLTNKFDIKKSYDIVILPDKKIERINDNG